MKQMRCSICMKDHRIFFISMCYEESDNEECIWHWVKSEDEDEKGFHPNGTRYFLYQAEKSLQFAYEGAQQEINDFEKISGQCRL